MSSVASLPARAHDSDSAARALRVPRSRALRALAFGVAVVSALLIHARTLDWGFTSDDYGHLMMREAWLRIAEVRSHRNPLSLYDFGKAPQPGDTEWELGLLPWWVAEDWKLSFFRPLGAATLWVDHALYGRAAIGYHLSSLVWFALGLLSLLALYRALRLPSGVSALAMLIFAVDESTALPVGYVANRHILLAFAFTACSVAALEQLERWGQRRALGLGFALACLATLSQEGGVVAFALLASRMLWITRATPQRLSARSATVSIGACAGVALAYLLLRSMLGFGEETLFYVTPWNEPVAYLGRLATLLSAGVLALAFPVPLDLLYFRQDLMPAAARLSAAILVPFAWLVWRVVRKRPAMGFLAAWIPLTLLPQAGAPVAERSLFMAAAGSSAILATFVVEALRTLRRPGVRARFVLATLAGIVFLGSVPLSALGLISRQDVFASASHEIRRMLAELELDGPEPGHVADVFLLKVPYAEYGVLPTILYAAETGEFNVRFWPMQLGIRELRLDRIDERTFDLSSLEDPFLSRKIEGAFLTHSRSPSPGQSWRTAAFAVEARVSDPSGLRRFRVSCSEPLEAYRFVDFRDGALRRVSLPPPGGSLLLPRSDRALGGAR